MAMYVTPFERTGMNLIRSMRDWEDEFFGKSASVMTCKSDLRDVGDAYILEAELPGFKRDEIVLDVEDNVLTLTAEHKAQEEEKDKGTYLRRERSTCTYQQKLDVAEIDLESMKATYEDGVLTLTMPKKTAAAPQKRRIDIL